MFQDEPAISTRDDLIQASADLFAHSVQVAAACEKPSKSFPAYAMNICAPLDPGATDMPSVRFNSTMLEQNLLADLTALFALAGIALPRQHTVTAAVAMVALMKFMIVKKLVLRREMASDQPRALNSVNRAEPGV